MATTTSATNGPASASAGGEDPATARTLVWQFLASGWTASAAGNLVALSLGLRPVSAGWTVREIEHLRFIRSLARAGRIDP